MTAAPAIQIENVSHAYAAPGKPPLPALEGASLSIARGELVSLIGPSGCGKSTLLNLIGGLAAPDSGRILIDGETVRAPLPRKIVYVFQESALFPWRTVEQNVELGLEFQGVPRDERRPRARRWVEAVGLSGFGAHYPHQLSGGMKQRAQLARALALETEILLMDEPFAALDEQTRMVLGEELSVLLARAGKTILFVTHSLMEAVFLADRIAVFSARPGRIKQVIAVEEGHPRNRAFLTSDRLGRLRNQLYDLLHDEICRTLNLRPGDPAPSAGGTFPATRGVRP